MALRELLGARWYARGVRLETRSGRVNVVNRREPHEARQRQGEKDTQSRTTAHCVRLALACVASGAETWRIGGDGARAAARLGVGPLLFDPTTARRSIRALSRARRDRDRDRTARRARGGLFAYAHAVQRAQVGVELNDAILSIVRMSRVVSLSVTAHFRDVDAALLNVDVLPAFRLDVRVGDLAR